MFCGGTLVVDVRVICYSRVREWTSHYNNNNNQLYLGRVTRDSKN